MGDLHGIASVLQSMGCLARNTGENERARKLIGGALSLMEQIGCLHCSARYLLDLAFLAGASGEPPERVVRLLGVADALSERTGITVSTTSAGKIEHTLADARQQLGEAAYTVAWSEGQAMSLAQATAYVRESSG